MLRTERIQRAATFAYNAHLHQCDKAGYPYIFHLAEVAELMGEDEEAVIVALMHDAFEDTDLQLRDFSKEWDPDIIVALDLLTRKDGQSYMDYIAQIKKSQWKRTEEGFLICPEGRVLDQYEGDSTSRTRGGNLHISQMYAEKGHCEGCPRRSQCFRFGEYRRVGKNVVMEELQRKVDENLESEEGKGLCRQRSSQVEGAFGILKQNRGMTRFKRRGLKGVRMKFLLNCLGMNLYKYHLFWLKQRACNSTGKLN